MYKFETWLVGTKAGDYCIGFVRGSQQECQRMKDKYADGGAWSLSKVTLDNFTDA